MDGHHVHGIALPEGTELLYSHNYEQNDGFMEKAGGICREVQQQAFEKGDSVIHVVKPPFNIRTTTECI